MRYSRSHDVMQRVLLITTSYFVLAYSLYFLFAGHNNPGGGFIGGLTTACALAFIYLVFDRDTANEYIRFTFPALISIGLVLSLGTGAIGFFANDNYLTQYFDYFEIPFFGEVELTTALPFDLGIYFVVVGAAMVIMLTIADDEKEENEN
ncbi:MnhB domain-containing protein [Natribacillus halophilus]|uniref:Multicomponent Na+:H+ antiporter subunit B n=1 Tax=Natribacillus halophilus TaxID=549003 RepID=A0A1G8JRA3_9BACI|nr:MnhB domain-containing protein [Natribacillus halophilus]SDI33080.1 multicomponent Na+:H+ antiporter subunit B [Natribacillus halophilus]